MPPLLDRDAMERMISPDPVEEFRQICICIRMGDVCKARKLYKGVNINQPLSIWDRRTPLHLAISKQDTAMVQFLLHECSANPNDSDDKGRNALHIAVLEGNDEIIQLLIDHGETNFKAVDKWGQTALHLASLCTNTSAARLLLGHCIECLDYRQQDGITPLQIATMADNKPIAALFSAAAEQATVPVPKSRVTLFDVHQAGHHETLTPLSSRQSPRAGEQSQAVITATPRPVSAAVHHEERSQAKAAPVKSVDAAPVETYISSEDSLAAAAEPVVEVKERSAAAETSPSDVKDEVVVASVISKHEPHTLLSIPEHEAWRSQVLHYCEDQSLLSDLYNAKLASCCLELEQKHEELVALKSRLADFFEIREKLTAHTSSVEEWLSLFESEISVTSSFRVEHDKVCLTLKTTENAMSGLLHKIDVMVLQLKRKDSELQECRSENLILKNTVAKLEAQICATSAAVRNDVENSELQSTFKIHPLSIQQQRQQKQNERSDSIAKSVDVQEPMPFSMKPHSNNDSYGQPAFWSGPGFALPPCVMLGSAYDASDTWILDWNLTGYVVSSAKDDTTRRIEISLANTACRRVADLTDHLGFNKASLGQHSILFSSPRRNSSCPARIYYKSFDNFAVKSDWSATLPEEDVLALCLIGRNAAICSDRRILRILSQAGIHLSILCLDHTAISMAASTSNQLSVLMITSTGSYCYVLYAVEQEIHQIASGVCPVSPNCSVIWSGFSEQGLYITLDSSLFVRGLVYRNGSYQWMALLDASTHFTTPKSKIWPLGASSSDLLVVSIENTGDKRDAQCHPTPRRLTFKPPTMVVDTQNTDSEQRYLLNNIMICHHQSQDAAGKQRCRQ